MTRTRYSHTGDVPLALAVFLANDTYDHNADPFTISATTLLKPLRQIILPARLTPEQDMVPLPSMMKSRIGSAIHDSVEKAWTTNHRQAMRALGYPDRVIDRIKINPDPATVTQDDIPIYLEQRLTKTLGRWTVTGKFDFIGEGRVQDFKSTQVWTYLNQVNGEKYTQQGSIYRWLDPQRIYQNEMDIHYIFTDWSATKAKVEANYPKQQFLRQTFPLLSLPSTEAFIRSKLAQVEAYWDAPEAEIPACNDDELWRSEPVFKYYKNPDKMTRSTKNFDDRQAAQIYMSVEGKGQGLIKEVPGQVMACKYCPAFAICSQKDSLIAAGDLVMA
jgi:hypothetical protein